MDTVMTITAYGADSKKAVKACEDEINRLDALLSLQNKNSEIYRLNRNKTAEASVDTLTLISRSVDANMLTDGAFDITIEPLVRAWGFYTGLENRVPSKQEIETALLPVGSQNIEISQNSVRLLNGACVDLGGIAKGYASAKSAELLEDYGIESAIVSLGGNVRAVGAKPDGTLWSVAIADPDDPSKQIGTLKAKDLAVVTSGGYQRYFEENGEIYHHIINPKTGYPAKSGLKSVTIASEDDCLADALSTALFVMGREKAEALYKKNPGLFDAVLVTDDNKILVTDNLRDSFSCKTNFEVITP